MCDWERISNIITVGGNSHTEPQENCLHGCSLNFIHKANSGNESYEVLTKEPSQCEIEH